MNNKTIGEAISGQAPPRSFILDASVLDDKEAHQIVREDVKLNGIRFKFPAGFQRIDLLEECRALLDVENFDIMYDVTMQMLTGKILSIWMINDDGNEHLQDEIQITNKDMDLRGSEFINEYPVVVTWLTEFIGAMLLKKFPVPGKDRSASVQAPEKTAKKMRKLKESLS